MVSMVRLLVMLFTKILYEYAVHLPQHMVTVSVTTLNPGEMLICGLKKPHRLDGCGSMFLMFSASLLLKM